MKSDLIGGGCCGVDYQPVLSDNGAGLSAGP